MTIRMAVPGDAPAVEALLCRSYPALMAGAYAADVLAQALPLMTRANPALLASGTYYVEAAEGVIVGCGGWTFAAPGSGAVTAGLAHLRHFAVDPAFVGRGIARRLHDRCAQAATAAGAARFQAFSSLNAEPFYARMGLVRLDRVQIPMGEGLAFPAVLMEGPVAALP